MPVNRVLAGIAVNDVDAVLPWYEQQFGRPADARPMDILADYHFPSGAVIQLVANQERAGIRCLPSTSTTSSAVVYTNLRVRRRPHR